MTEVEVQGQPPAFYFGNELRDGFKPANAWVANGIAWLDDIQQFYRERSSIEKEYSQRLNGLAKKYFEKKLKKTTALSVGETPTRTPGSLESASLTTWTTQLTTLERRADEHDKFGTDLVGRVAEPLKALGHRFEELRKRHSDYSERLEKERETSYAELRKFKGKYDAACQEVETKRKKTESSFDKAKAQSQYQQQLIEMNNAKNTYLIAINVTNKQKEKYYHEYVPDLLDSLQDLSEFRTIKLNELWRTAATLESAMLQGGSSLMDALALEVNRNLPQLDSNMFIQHNVSDFRDPPDKMFEPSPVWHDDNTMVVDEMAKVYLRNVLAKSKGQLGELRREVDKKRREVEGVKRMKQRVRDGTEKKDEVEVVRQIFSMQEDLHQAERKRITAEVETSAITTAVGDVTLGARNHNFKAQSLKLPTNCDLCGDRIWGLSAKALACRDCSYTCHTKCEMKVAAECPGELNKDERKKVKAERQEQANALLKPTSSVPDHIAEMGPGLSRTNTMSSLSSKRSVPMASYSASPSSPAAPTPPDDAPPELPASTRPRLPPTATSTTTNTLRKNRIMAPPPTAYISELPGSTPGASNGSASSPVTEQKGKMLYTFEANGEGEIAVPEGRDVIILQQDDGTGWIKVRAGYKEGMVPATYLELGPVEVKAQHTGTAAAAKKKGPAVAPKRGAKKLKYVVAIYPYAAQSDTEHTMEEGEKFVLVKDDQGDGWAEVEKGGAVKSVPASYVQDI
ncbi:FCH-domain-containing protein [Zalerion maritima]|uniref:Protein BZZ1 n=1 Tax=Zalerion maritima TaxID=339359 RepID=A0AAD5RQT9_9PEZI|nr:FCH-domain-containing protein [Zalerion maritima]